MPLIFTEDMGKMNKTEDQEIPDSVLLEMKQERLEKVLDLIPPGDRAILLMKYTDDLSIREIGAVLGKTESAIKMQLMRAKQKVQLVHDELFEFDPMEGTK